MRILDAHEVHDTCPACGGRRRVAFGERVHGADVAWYAATSCDSCGARAEADGRGDLPDDLLAAELVRNGRWGVTVRVEPRVSGWSALRDRLGLDLAAVAALKRRIPGVVFEGTHARADRVCALLISHGATAELIEVQLE